MYLQFKNWERVRRGTDDPRGTIAHKAMAMLIFFFLMARGLERKGTRFPTLNTAISPGQGILEGTSERDSFGGSVSSR